MHYNIKYRSSKEESVSSSDLSPRLSALLLDPLVRLEEKPRGEREPERLGRLEIDDQFEPHGLLDGEVRGLGPFQDFVDLDGQPLI